MKYDAGILAQYDMLGDETGLSAKDVKEILGSEARDWIISSDQLILNTRIGVGSSGEVFMGTFGGKVVAIKR
jgi:hypothetical protein